MSSNRIRIAAGVATVVLVGAMAGTSLRHAADPGARTLGTNRVLAPGGDPAPGSTEGSGAEVSVPPTAGQPATPGLSRPLGSLVPGPARVTPWVKRELTRDAEGEAEPARAASGPLQADGALQTRGGPAQMPAPSTNFGGMSYKANGRVRLVPPDTNGDVGTSRFVQAVNVRFAVYNKDTGSRVAGPTTISSLFRSSGPSAGKLCSTHDDGDPVVIYDEIADRWVLTQFALNFRAGVFAECIAVSQTSAAAGKYWVYQFRYPGTSFNDYPKFGVWPDGYYASFNEFDRVTEGSKGVGVIAYDRDSMLAGITASQIYAHPAGSFNLASMLPSDLDGPPPPVGAPNLFVQIDPDEFGYPQDQLEVWSFHVDWAVPSNSSFDPVYGQLNGVPTASFSPFVCGTSTTYCIPQRGTKKKLDAISDRLMFRLQYRNLGSDDQRLTVAQTVRAPGSRAGVRWYVLQGNDAFTAWSILDQGTYAPADGRSRWMGSAALDGDGNLAVGYSLSGPTMYPSIAYAGKPAADVGVPGTGLTLSERRAFTGTGSEVGDFNRWGDYSDLTVDPVDGCTFHYTDQYYGASGQFGWRTRVVAFKLPACT